MAAHATAVQIDNDEPLIHPRGYCVSAHLTCPKCGYLLFADRINRTNGVAHCGCCKRKILIGLVAFILPECPQSEHILATDMSLPPAERSALGIRRRSRRRRIAFLAQLGFDPAMPQIDVERYVAGMPINRVVLVPAPESQLPAVPEAESQHPTNPPRE